MMVIPERALNWVERWSQHGLNLGRHDGNGNLLLEHEADDAVATDMIAEIQTDAALRHGVGIIVLQMCIRADAEGGWADD